MSDPHRKVGKPLSNATVKPEPMQIDEVTDQENQAVDSLFGSKESVT